ncbi:cyclin-G1 [Strongylocentrotus purpuratus]|uniref:Cyclin-like domain-containing protein n=1 Tax=Strongylocentrotus purpuratus TaxID=7668 RepID=A0A7M7RF55_STRPU|nr:cyclin-G1 [Strongylocentrotus purpuratus]
MEKGTQSMDAKAHLVKMMQVAVETEDFYQPYLEYICQQQEDSDCILPYMHDVILDRLRSLSRFFQLCPETFFLAVNTMDRFLSLVKARPHHLMCIAISSYNLAIKALEPSESSISAEDLVRISQCGCSVNDVLRMERIILQKLQCDLQAPTAHRFFKLFHAYSVVQGILGNDTAMQNTQLESSTQKLEACLCYFPLTLYKPSVLALALLTHELPNASCEVHNPNDIRWMRIVWDIQRVSQVSDNDLVSCRSQVSECLRMYSSPVSRMPHSRLTWIVSTRTARQLKFSAQISSDLPPIPENRVLNSSLLSDGDTDESCEILSDVPDIQSSPSEVEVDDSDDDKSSSARTLVLNTHQLASLSTDDSICVERKLFTYEDESLAYCPTRIHGGS